MTRHFLICIYTFKSCTEKPMSYLNNNKKINLHVKQNKFWLFRASNYIWQVLFPPLCIMYFNKGMWTQVNDEKTYIKQLKNIFQNNYLKYFLKLTYDSKCMKSMNFGTLGYIKITWELYFYVLQQISRLWFKTGIHIMRYTGTSISEFVILSSNSKS